MSFSKNDYYGYILKGDLLGAIGYVKRFPEQAGLYRRYMDIFEREGGIRKTARRINNWQTVRQNWEKQMHQLGMAGHLLFVLSPCGCFQEVEAVSTY